jgi:hypothetical protein
MNNRNQPTSSPEAKSNKDSTYPVSDQFKVLDGYDIYRSSKLIVALVVVESNFGKVLRMYRWQMRNNSWKVDLCRMSVGGWNWGEISTKAQELIQKHGIRRKGPAAEPSE